MVVLLKTGLVIVQHQPSWCRVDERGCLTLYMTPGEDTPVSAFAAGEWVAAMDRTIDPAQLFLPQKETP